MPCLAEHVNLGCDQTAKFKFLKAVRMENRPRPRLLVVDDEVDLLELFSKRLIKAGFVVSSANSGAEAIELIKTQTFDVVICDINMPGGVNGFDVFDFIRQKNDSEKPPFVFVTGHGEGTPEMDRALSLGVDGVFSKPISSRVLIQHLQKLCGLESA